jgi:hypothetical protein
VVKRQPDEFYNSLGEMLWVAARLRVPKPVTFRCSVLRARTSLPHRQNGARGLRADW